MKCSNSIKKPVKLKLTTAILLDIVYRQASHLHKSGHTFSPSFVQETANNNE